MDEWLHCNHCCARFSKSNPTTFLITNCAHIYCAKCEKEATNPVCIVCKKKCSTAILNEKLDKNAAIFFKPPQELENKAMEVRRFQENQRRNLMKSLVYKLEQQNQFLQSATISIEKLKKENLKFKSENSELRRFFRHNKANLSISPNSSFLVSPDPSPRGTPRITPSPMAYEVPIHDVSMSPHTRVFTGTCKRISPSPKKQQAAKYRVSQSVPNTPNSRHHNHPNSHMWAEYQKTGKRVTISSPPVNGKIPRRSPVVSQLSNYSQGYVSSDGIVSRQASSQNLQSSQSTPKAMNYSNSPKPMSGNTTPFSTPKAYLKPASQSSQFSSYYGLSAKRRF